MLVRSKHPHIDQWSSMGIAGQVHKLDMKVFVHVQDRPFAIQEMHIVAGASCSVQELVAICDDVWPGATQSDVSCLDVSVPSPLLQVTFLSYAAWVLDGLLPVERVLGAHQTCSCTA